MIRKKQTIIVFFLFVTFIISSCATNIQPETSQQHSSLPVETVGTAVLTSETPSVPHTVSPLPVTASPAPTAIQTLNTPGTPSITPIPSGGCVTNRFTASDGKYIYYFPGDGVYRMDMQGNNIRKLNIKHCYEFLEINGTSLYYLEYDFGYNFTKNEENWQWFNSFNLMIYNTKTNKATPIKKHILNAIVFGGKIYIIDHYKHSHIISYDILSRQRAEILGIPERNKKDAEVADLQIKDDGLHFSYTNDEANYDSYWLHGDTATKEPTETDTDMPTDDPIDFYAETSDGCKWKINYGTKTLSLWTGNEYKDVGLQDFTDLFYTGSKILVVAENVFAGSVALYALTNNGGAIKIAEKNEEQGGLSIENDFINGWFFSIWDEGEGGTACGLLIMQKVE